MELRTLRYFVAVAEERHFGRAAARLRMTQPPLSRAIKRLETDLGRELLRRSPTGVSLTPAGVLLYDEARTLLAQADKVRARMDATAALTLGTLAGSADQRLVEAYRRRHPTAQIRIRESDLTDPTVGLRAGLVDVALTRAPFDDSGLSVRVLRSDPVGAVLRADDPLTGRGHLRLDDLADRPWFQFPEGTDPLWRAFWTGLPGAGRGGPVVRTVEECLQSVLWNGSVGLTPLPDTQIPHALPDGLTAVPVVDSPPSDLVIAWNSASSTSLIRSFVHIAIALYRPSRP
ncbi:LysR family transcriptional regulator [Actinomadura roseirufa]|uniref:LysR family transcriptional regulator n=1 Tax=Actinomadura roseirufa TaxID=2094049 RepID=UPI0010414730|nr:LysR family transcriptional regulator [Actinomadura roseirufa]